MAIKFLNNGVFSGDVTIPEYIYHTGNTSQDRFGFASNDTFVIRTNGTDKFTADANSAILLEAGITKLQTTSTGISISGQATGTFSGDISTSGDGQTNTPFRLGYDYNSYMVAAAGNTWGLFWAGNSGARYGTNGNGGPGNIWGNSGNPNEFAFVGSDSTVWTVYGNNGNVWQKGDLWVDGGDIVLGGATGRIQGIDTVSVGTDAANKTYVDNAISGVPQGTITGGGQNLRLALWDGSSSIGSDGDFTYNGNTIFTTKLSVQNQINTNSANLEINYANGDGTTTNFKNFDIRNGKNATIANFNGASKLTTLQGDLTVNGGDLRLGAVMLQDSGAGRLGFNRDTGNGAIHDSSYNAFQIQVNTSGASGMLEIQEYTGAGGFVGNTFITGTGITINDYVTHNGDATTKFGFSAADTFVIRTNDVERFSVNNSGVALGSGSRVTAILDQDNMSSNSATALATQQSIKQYVDTAITTTGNVTTSGFTSGRIPFANSSINLDNSADLAWDDSNKKLVIGQPTSQGASGTVVAIDGRMYIEDPGTDWNETTPGLNQGSLHFDPQPPSTNNIGNAITFGASDAGSGTTSHAGIYTRSDGNYGTKMYIATTDSYAAGSKTAITIQQSGAVAINRSHLTIGDVPAASTSGNAFLVSNSGQVQFRTNTQVRSDIGAGRVDTVSDDGGSTINVSGSATARTVAAVTGAVSASSANLATGAQIQTAINTAIVGVLSYQGTWNASTNSPALASGVGTPGYYYIVSTAGSTNLDGITDWAVGDWAVFSDLATDAWQKIDNTQVGNVTGSGANQRLAFWNSTSNIASDDELTWDGVNLNIGTYAGTGDCELRLFGSTPNNSFSTIKTTNGNLHIDSDNGHAIYLNYYLGGSTSVIIGNGAGGVSGTQFNASGDVTIGDELTVSTINNATIDTDKFAVYDSGNKLYYRTGAQVLSDIGAQASGSYLPVANPTFTGTLTGPTIRATSGLSVDGAILAGNTFSDPDLVLTVLDTDTTESVRDKIYGSSLLTKVSDSTAPAPGVFAVNGALYPQGFGPSYTIDEGDTFIFEFWVKKESGAATSALLYAGANFYNAAGTYLGNSQRYWGESGLQVANMTDWYHVSGTLGPARGTNTSQIPTTAVSMRLLFLFNYNANASIVTHYCGLKVYKSGKTVTQLYRKTLGSEASTGRNRDLVVDQNGDLYGSNLTITGNLIGSINNTTELGTYSTGAIKRIRMCQGGELHFGDTTTTAPLGITEGDWNNFGDQDRLSIYGRASIKFYAGSTSAVLAATLQSTGLTLNTITNATTDTDKFLVSDSGVIKYRTGAQVLSDIGAASSGSLGNYLPLAGGTMSGTINSTATTALQMDGAATAQGILLQADSSGTYPVFLRSVNPASGGETSAWLFKENTTAWGIWHNNPVNSFDFTRSGNNLGIANNVGGQTNSVMIRLNNTDGFGTFAGKVTSAATASGDASTTLTTKGYVDAHVSPVGTYLPLAGGTMANTNLVTNMNADLLDGHHASFTRNSANTIPLRDANGYLQLGWINTTSGATTATINKIYVSDDNYIRYITPATFRSQVIDGSYLPVANPTFTGTLTGPNANFTSTVTIDNMLTITIDDISTGENRGLRLINEAGTDQQWNITAGTTGATNDDFCIRDATNNVNAFRLSEATGNATFAGTIFTTAIRTDSYQSGAGNILFLAGNTTTGASRSLNLRHSGSTVDPSSSDDSNSTGITWGQRSDSTPYYIIYPQLENWSSSGNYSKLTLAWHTGIKIGAASGYGGTRFYNNSPDVSGAGVIFNVGVGNSNVGVVYNLTVGGDITIGGRDLIFSNTGTNDANVTSSLGINFIVGSSLSGLEIDAFGGVTTYNVLTTGGSIIVGGGGIQLNGTGRITGVDTVSASTDAANKAYVDAATSGAMTGFGVSNLPSGTGTTFTITNGQTVGIVGGTNIQSVVNTTNETITLNYTGGTGSGSVTSVTAGTGMTQTGTSTINPTLNVIGGTGITANANDIAVDYAGADSIIMAAPGGSGPDADDYFLYGADSSGGGESVKYQFVDLPLSILDNDAGFTSNAGVVLTSGNQSISGTKTFTTKVISADIEMTGVQSRAKLSVWSGSTYGFGMQSGFTFGGLANEYAITSQMSNSSGRGFWWGDSSHTNAQGAMALTTTGLLTVASGMRLAYGEGDTTSPGSTYKLDVGGHTLINGTGVVRTSTGVGDFYLGNFATAKHFRFHTNNSQTYFDMNCGQINWREGSSIRYYFYPSTANMTINGTLTQNSDSRVKENVVEIGDCIGKVQAMRGVYYNRTDFNTEVTKVGVIAQEVEAVLPELILEASDTGLKSVAYAELTAVLINAIKEQQEIIEDLKTRIIKLEK